MCRWALLNPASMKQALVEAAARTADANMFEQGQGKLNLLGSRVRCGEGGGEEQGYILRPES